MKTKTKYIDTRKLINDNCQIIIPAKIYEVKENYVIEFPPIQIGKTYIFDFNIDNVKQSKHSVTATLEV